MAVRDVHIPKMGMSTQEVDIVAIHIREGQKISRGAAIADIESEKVTFTLEAEFTGTVREVLIEPGSQMVVGDVVCRIEEDPE